MIVRHGVTSRDELVFYGFLICIHRFFHNLGLFGKMLNIGGNTLRFRVLESL
jgi:hypothetical protein